MNSNRRDAKRPYPQIAFIAVTTVLGMQMLRALIPYFVFVLRDRLDWAATTAGLVAILIFLCAFLAGPLNRFLGSMPTFVISAIVLGFTRLALQLWNYDPLGDMILATTGAIAFLIFLPVALGLARRLEDQGPFHLGLGILAGLASDLAINGAFLSYDLSWQSGWLPALIVVLLVGAQWLLTGRLMREELSENTADAAFRQAISWIFLGPYLFLQLLIFANIAWATTTTGLSFPAAFTLLLAAQLAGLATAILPASVFRPLILITLSLTLLLTILFVVSGPQAWWITALFLLLGQIALSGLLLSIVRGLAGDPKRQGLRNITIAHGLGMLLLIIFLFSYYIVYDVRLPFQNNILPLLAFIITILAGLGSLWRANQSAAAKSSAAPMLAPLMLLLIIPLVQLLTWQEAEPSIPSGQTIRVMTYNLHNGADPRGHIGLEALAQVIERENPDVVGLQEVSRGWVINGSVDMLTWLSQRLGMTAVFGPTADAQWGNAVLTRLPVLTYENEPLPTDDLLLRRGFMALSLDGGGEHPLNLINTHYHHTADGSNIRVQETHALLGSWSGKPRSAVMGDLNAEHGDPEIDLYGQADFGDVLDLTGVIPGYTNPVPDPYRRIDYIFITPDLQASDAVIPPDEASDHLAIAVTLK